MTHQRCILRSERNQSRTGAILLYQHNLVCSGTREHGGRGRIRRSRTLGRTAGSRRRSQTLLLDHLAHLITQAVRQNKIGERLTRQLLGFAPIAIGLAFIDGRLPRALFGGRNNPNPASGNSRLPIGQKSR